MRRWLAPLIGLFLALCMLAQAQQVARRPIVAGASEPLLTNLAAYWKLDDLTDASGNGNTLTNNNTATFNTGKVGNAVYTVQASSQSLSIASNSFVQTGDVSWTISAWIYAQAAGGVMAWVSKTGDSAGQGEYAAYYTSSTDNKLHAQVYTPTDVGRTVDSTGTITTGTWYLVIVWHDATADTINMSRDNGTADSVGTTGALQSASNAAFRIGRNGTTGFEFHWDGRIDEVGIWKRVLTAGERTRLYNTASGCTYPFNTCP